MGGNGGGGGWGGFRTEEEENKKRKTDVDERLALGGTQTAVLVTEEKLHR